MRAHCASLSQHAATANCHLSSSKDPLAEMSAGLFSLAHTAETRALGGNQSPRWLVIQSGRGDTRRHAALSRPKIASSNERQIASK